MKEKIAKIVPIALVMILIIMVAAGCREGICREEHDRVNEQVIEKAVVLKTEDGSAGDQAFFVKIFLFLRSKSWCLKRADKDDYY